MRVAITLNCIVLGLLAVAVAAIPLLAQGTSAWSSWLTPLAFASAPLIAALIGMRKAASWFMAGFAAAINVSCALLLAGMVAAVLTGIGGAIGLLIPALLSFVLFTANAVLLARIFRRKWALKKLLPSD